MARTRQPADVDRLSQEPVRTCVGCRGRTVRPDLLRLVVGEVDARECVVPDPRHRSAGRGAWLHPDLACLALAERRRAFPRAFRREGPLDVRPVREYLESAVRTAGSASSGEDHADSTS